MKKELILASGSPRRRELLALVCADFRVCVAQTEEVIDPRAEIGSEVLRLAQEKAQAVFEKTTGARCVIGADTMVVYQGEALGKPRDTHDAARMLRMLSGNTHQVLTAVAYITDAGVQDSALTRTQVTFYPLQEQEIARYIATGEPMDKAGAYGIQGVGALLVQEIVGDYYSVMGLPIAKLARMLQAGGICMT